MPNTETHGMLTLGSRSLESIWLLVAKRCCEQETLRKHVAHDNRKQAHECLNSLHTVHHLPMPRIRCWGKFAPTRESTNDLMQAAARNANEEMQKPSCALIKSWRTVIMFYRLDDESPEHDSNTCGPRLNGMLKHVAPGSK